MEWIALATTLIPFVVKMIGFVEGIFGNGTGETKKAAVMGATQAVFEGMQQISTGGQKQTWEALQDPVSILVDKLVDVANATGVWGSGKGGSVANDV